MARNGDAYSAAAAFGISNTGTNAAFIARRARAGESRTKLVTTNTTSSRNYGTISYRRTKPIGLSAKRSTSG